MQQPDPAQVHAMMAMMLPFMALMGIIGSVVLVIPFWQIFKKAGMAAPLSLLILVPVVGLVMLYVLAFSRWNVVPAPDYGAGYPPPYPPPGYPPAPAAYAPPAGYAPTGNAPAYVPPPADPPTSI
jgi:hypothetical protein